MSSTPKTIQIFLPSGDPRGIRIAEITTRTVQVIEVPRSLLAEFLQMNESRQVALYFLFGGDDDEPQVYIGQTGDLRNRLKTHNSSKDFWEKALVLVSRTDNLTQTHALFLEWLCLQKTREAGRFKDCNGNSGSKPHTPAPLEADCYELFETGSTLLASLGYPLFTPVALQDSSSDEDLIYHCTAVGSQARGVFTPEGFVVLKGSIGRLENVKSLRDTSDERFRQRLIDKGIMVPDGDRVVFSKDHLFNSPSMAAIAVVARNANGWKIWKTTDGRTLEDIERVSSEDDRDD